MKKTALLKVVNPILALLLVSQIVTGLLGKSLPHEAFEVLHGGGGIALAVVSVIHVFLNWGWVKATFRLRAQVAKD